MGSSRVQPHAPRPPLDNLPLELTSFVGRDREVVEVKGLLADRRLLTLCGPGGSGKTRLALAVARRHHAKDAKGDPPVEPTSLWGLGK